jgi:hypothetical protein
LVFTQYDQSRRRSVQLSDQLFNLSQIRKYSSTRKQTVYSSTNRNRGPDETDLYSSTTGVLLEYYLRGKIKNEIRVYHFLNHNQYSSRFERAEWPKELPKVVFRWKPRNSKFEIRLVFFLSFICREQNTERKKDIRTVVDAKLCQTQSENV